MVDVSIIIVSWNVREQLRACLQSIQTHSAGVICEVIVVDNASHDESADMVAKDFPAVRLIRNDKNLGFGAANNQGVKLAQGECVLFLNDDCELTGNIFPALVGLFQSKQKLGMVGVKLLNRDGSNQPSVRAWPGVLNQTVIQLKLHHLFPRLVNRYLMTDFNYSTAAAVPQVMGAFMCMPLSLAKQYGPFDEDFFVWFEEIDLQLRLQRDGYVVWYEPSLVCIHAKGQSFQQLARPNAQRLFNRSLRTYMRKHHGVLAYLWFLSLHPISMILAYGAQMVR
ncbi:MAG: glycosyltransferase family 2 protein [Candidatus Kerfeldbacteria bacterium]|nr:glycosyltransferase family 2 protein [Candidatus Kerfeldbacteria bacterium]